MCCTSGPHGPYRLSQKYNRYSCEPFCSCKCRFSWISPFFVLMPLKTIQTVILISLSKKQTYILLQIDREGSCVLKLELLMQACSYCRDKKGMQFRSHSGRRWRNFAQNVALTFTGKLRLKKIYLCNMQGWKVSFQIRHIFASTQVDVHLWALFKYPQCTSS